MQNVVCIQTAGLACAAIAMIDLQDILSNLVHVGALFYLVCFLFRNQILLRSFAIAGDLAYAAYYFNVADQPLWGAILWNIPTILINVVMIALILRDKRTSNFTDNELKLYRSLKSLAPAEFRRIVKIGKWGRTSGETVLAVEGKPLDHLHYVLEGQIEVEKSGRSIPVTPGMFVGEVAFLKQWPASATVRIGPGTLYMSWPHAALTKAQLKHDGLNNAIGAMLNADMAEKVARS